MNSAERSQFGSQCVGFVPGLGIGFLEDTISILHTHFWRRWMKTGGCFKRWTRIAKTANRSWRVDFCDRFADLHEWFEDFWNVKIIDLHQPQAGPRKTHANKQQRGRIWSLAPAWWTQNDENQRGSRSKAIDSLGFAGCWENWPKLNYCLIWVGDFSASWNQSCFFLHRRKNSVSDIVHPWAWIALSIVSPLHPLLPNPCHPNSC